MASQTPRLGLPVPGLGDVADIEVAAGSLASAIDAQMLAMLPPDTAVNRPPAGVPRRVFYATDEGRLYLDVGVAWRLIGAAGPAGGDLTGTFPTPVIADGAVTAAKLSGALKPSGVSPDANPTIRALGTGAGQAAPGTHAAQHAPGGADPLPQRAETTVTLDSVAVPELGGMAGLTGLAASSSGGPAVWSSAAPQAFRLLLPGAWIIELHGTASPSGSLTAVVTHSLSNGWGEVPLTSAGSNVLHATWVVRAATGNGTFSIALRNASTATTFSGGVLRAVHIG